MITTFLFFFIFLFFIKVKIIYINYIMNVSTTSTTNPVNMYDYINSLVFNPIVFITILLIIIGYFVLFSSLGNPNETSIYNTGTDVDKGQKLVGIIIISVLIVLIIINAFQYFFNVNITAYVKDIFSNKVSIPSFTKDKMPIYFMWRTSKVYVKENKKVEIKEPKELKETQIVYSNFNGETKSNTDGKEMIDKIKTINTNMVILGAFVLLGVAYLVKK